MQTSPVDGGLGLTRRRLLGAAAVFAGGGLAFGRHLVPSWAAASTDWSKEVVDSTMARYPDPTTLGSGNWNYPVGFYLSGQYLVYRRTGNSAYLSYIKRWVDKFVDATGKLNAPVDRLDHVMPATLLLLLHDETGLSRYKTAADQVRARILQFPKTADGAYWHTINRTGQRYADGTFMIAPFLVRHGLRFGSSASANDDATLQLRLYAEKLQNSSGRLYHAYDETRASSWADPSTGLSPEFWGRGVGWYALAVLEVLDALPGGDPRRAGLLASLRSLLVVLLSDQDRATGLWWQVLDRPGYKGSAGTNWLETSCSAMFTFAFSRSAQRGYVDSSYASAAGRGYPGVLSRISLDASGRANLTTICQGTGPGSLTWYLSRRQLTNDLHGLGAFLQMNEQLAGSSLPDSTTTTSATTTTIPTSTVPPTSTTVPPTSAVTLRRLGSGTVELSWTAVAGATQYRWQLQTCAGQMIVTSDTTAQVKSYSGLANDCYRGRVMANVNGVWGPWRTSADLQLT